MEEAAKKKEKENLLHIILRLLWSSCPSYSCCYLTLFTTRVSRIFLPSLHIWITEPDFGRHYCILYLWQVRTWLNIKCSFKMSRRQVIAWIVSKETEIVDSTFVSQEGIVWLPRKTIKKLTDEGIMKRQQKVLGVTETSKWDTSLMCMMDSWGMKTAFKRITRKRTLSWSSNQNCLACCFYILFDDKK